MSASLWTSVNILYVIVAVIVAAWMVVKIMSEWIYLPEGEVYVTLRDAAAL